LAAEAEQAARAIRDLGEQAEALSAVAGALAGADRHRALALAAEAEQVACALPGTHQQARALQTVAQVLALAGLWEQAEQAARAIPDTLTQPWVLYVVVKRLAAAGRWEQAEQAARAITETSMQSRALETVAEGLITAYLDYAAAGIPASMGEQHDRSELLRLKARRLVGDLLGSEYWFRAIQLLGKLSPVEVVTIGEAILAQRLWKN
jgi:hypothetical protein